MKKRQADNIIIIVANFQSVMISRHLLLLHTFHQHPSPLLDPNRLSTHHHPTRRGGRCYIWIVMLFSFKLCYRLKLKKCVTQVLVTNMIVQCRKKWLLAPLLLLLRMLYYCLTKVLIACHSTYDAIEDLTPGIVIYKKNINKFKKSRMQISIKFYKIDTQFTVKKSGWTYQFPHFNIAIVVPWRNA